MPHIAYMETAGGGGGGLTIFNTKNQSVGTVPPSPLPDPPKASRTSLLALLSVSGEEDFEAYANNDRIGIALTSIAANGITAAITAHDSADDSELDPLNNFPDPIRSTTTHILGRYNTSPEGAGTKFLSCSAGNYLHYIKLTFSQPVAAFWLYITDLGDFNASLEIKFYKTGGGTDIYTPDAPAGAAEGALNFFGIVDDRGTVTYDAVSMRPTNQTDVMGLDGIGFATAAQIL